MRAPSSPVALATVALLCLIWGTTWAAIRVSLEGFPPFTGVTLRFALAGALLALVAKASGLRLRAASRRERNVRLAHAGLSICVSYGVVFWTEQWLPSGLAAVLFATYPLLVALMAHLWLPAERLTLLGGAGIALGFSGLLVIYAEDFEAMGGPQVAVAAVVMLLAPLASAAAAIILKRWGGGLNPITLNAAAMGMGSAAMAVLALLAEHDRPPVLSLGTLTALLYLAVLGSALSFTLWTWLIEHTQARRLALIGYVTPVVALAVGALFLDERVTVRMLVGSALVVIGVAAAVHERR